MRERYQEQLRELYQEMVGMGSMCEKAISIAIQALTTNDESLLKKVFEVDSSIDKKEREIESLCLKLLLQQQPVASDLREISSALKMISDMERIGDQAADIAENAQYIIGKQNHSGINLEEMAREAIKMVTNSIDSFVKSDLDLARYVISYDDVVDNWFIRIKEELIEKIAKDSGRGEYYLDLFMIAKYLERIGDHATNIGEWVEYSITGARSKDGVFPE